MDQETTAQTSTLSPVSKTSFLKYAVAVFGGIFLLSISACAGYWYGYQTAFKKSALTKEKSTPQPLTVSPTPSPINPTAGWKKYLNPTYGYEIRYPADWFLESTSEKTVSISNYRIGEQIDTSKGEYGDLGISVQPNFGFSSAEEWINDTNSRISKGKLVGTPIEIIETVTISGKKAIKTKGTTPGIIDPLYTYYLQKEGNLFIIDFRLMPADLEKEVGKTLSRILSTFRFLDTEGSDPTAGWKSYTNNKHSFSLKYPSNWSFKKSSEESMQLSDPTGDFNFRLLVERTTGFGYCFTYGEKKTILVGGVSSETADGIGGSPMCEDSGEMEKFQGIGTTYVLIPLEDNGLGIPPLNVHLDFFYPLGKKEVAKSTFNQILSTFRFLD